MDERICGFPPVYREDAEILILGSMPSVESLKQEFYYAHPRNVFWPLMADILGEAVPQTVNEKKKLLIRHHIALWDTASSCIRPGSLDSSIRSVQPNDFDALFQKCPRIGNIYFNGAAALDLYRKHVCKADPYRSFHRMPSTSPAYTMKYECKLAVWRSALEEVLSIK